ncbi:glycosyltransferase family 4 protein [Rhizobium leguminosarum]|uniref:glycosyltransferase family 4 protein n=1 Tax=Rhizobium leguminosarum TaxID=384 RepID=UPI0028F4233F|nr:glycosyltransferase family 4 protein [Rhizobium leguminosarum]
MLFFVTEDWYFHSHRLPLAVAAIAKGCEVVVATRVTNHQEKIEKEGIRVVPLRRLVRSSLNPFQELCAIAELYSVVVREKPDVIHNVAMKPVLYGSVVAMVTGVSRRINALGGLGFVFSSQNLQARVLRRFIISLFHYLLNRRGTAVIVQNKEDYDVVTRACAVDEARVHLIPGAGVDLNMYVPMPLAMTEPVVMLASRMIWDKGINEFVEAAKLLRAEGVNARFVLVGKPDGENPASVPASDLQRWGLEGAVELWGHRQDMPQTLAEASIVCLPTYYGEGVPKVLIEAMACGRPIVTTDMAGCRELVEDGKAGLLVKPRDIESLTAALRTLLLDHAKCKALGEEGRKLASAKYSLPMVVEGVLNLYGLGSLQTSGGGQEREGDRIGPHLLNF